MTYAIFLYDGVLKSYDPIRVVDATKIEHSKVFYANDCRRLPEWQSIIIFEFDAEGESTGRSTLFNKNATCHYG